MAGRRMAVLRHQRASHKYGYENESKAHEDILWSGHGISALARARRADYDYNHMLPDPYDRIPTTALRRLSADAGDLVFHQGMRTHGLFVVRSGRVHLERVGPDGARFVIHRALPGTSFAEASVFSQHYHCDARVVEAGDLVRIDKASVLAAFADPDFARAYGRQSTQLIQAQRQLMEIIGIRRANDRVIAGMVAGLLDGSIVDFAARLQLTHEATYRALRQLVDAGQVLNPSRGIYRLP